MNMAALWTEDENNSSALSEAVVRDLFLISIFLPEFKGPEHKVERDKISKYHTCYL